MHNSNNSSITPRNGYTLIVGIGARISGCANQKEQSLQDQIEHGKEVTSEMYSGPVEFRIIATTGKGERLDRPELEQIEKEMRSRELDLYIFEDLGRLVRGPDAVRLLGIAKDHGTRVIIPNDCLDTDDSNWEEDALNACASHVAHNAHTSKRLKKKLMNRFRKFGGAPGRPIYGYIVPLGVKTYDGWLKDSDAAPHIQAGARLLRESLNCTAVAEYFNAHKVPTGPYCRQDHWDSAMIRRFYKNPLLKGQPERGNRHSIKHHEFGTRISVPNPAGPSVYECPHLVIIDPLEFDELNAALNANNAGFGRKKIHGVDPKQGVSRKRTRFPGHYARCWYCGELCVWGGNGITEHMMCNGSRGRRCWNAVGFSGGDAAKKVVAIISEMLHQLEGFSEQFRVLVRAAAENQPGNLGQLQLQLEKKEAELTKAKTNLQNSLAEYGPSPLIKEKLDEIGRAELQVRIERDVLLKKAQRKISLPESVVELRQIFEDHLAKLASDDFHCADLLRRLVPEFHVYLVRLCDGGHPVPCARVKLDLAGLIPEATVTPDLSALLSRVFTLELFEPPQREQVREKVVSLIAEGFTQREIAQELKTHLAVVQRACLLINKMQSMGLANPYILVTHPPDDYTKLRRHNHPNYKFTIVDGFRPPPL